MTTIMYDVCVVGAGMVGSAAAKWLTKLQPEMNVCLIGPKEPTEEEWQTRSVFSSHYDEGRLTREMDESLIYATLAQRSIHRYKQIEEESGMKIDYTEVGCGFIDVQGRESLLITKQNAVDMGVTSYKALDAAGLKERFPYLHMEENWEFLFNFNNAGYISPRKLVAAQQKIAARHCCDVIDDVVVRVLEEEEHGGDGGGSLKIVCQSGREVCVKRVLLCTGAFSNFHSLLPGGKQIEFRPKKIFVVKAEVSEEYANGIADMPSLIVNVEEKKSYILPPLKYLDGKYYVKIGGYKSSVKVASDLEDMAEWFRTEAQHEEQKESTLDILKFFLPDLDPLSICTSRCVVSYPPTGMLYCDMVSPHLGVVMGLMGKGAKSSDEIGRMGAQMIAKGTWDYDIPAENFKLKFKSTDGDTKSLYKLL